MLSLLKFERPFFTARCVAPTATGSWSGKNHDHVLTLMGHFGIRKAFVPTVSAFSGRIATASDLMEIIELDHGRQYRTCATAVEGGEVAVGEALMVGAGGCPFIVAYDTIPGGVSRMIFAHAGRDSLIDRKRIDNGTPREHEGILYAIAAAFEDWGTPPNRVSIEAFFSIDPEVFLHSFDIPGDEERAQAHRALYRDIRRRWGDAACYEAQTPDGHPAAAIDQPQLILAQAQEIGFGFCRHQGLLPLAGPYPHTRHPVEAMRGKRNMIILHRTA